MVVALVVVAVVIVVTVNIVVIIVVVDLAVVFEVVRLRALVCNCSGNGKPVAVATKIDCISIFSSITMNDKDLYYNYWFHFKFLSQTSTEKVSFFHLLSISHVTSGTWWRLG